jgi:hypothetical protein
LPALQGPVKSSPPSKVIAMPTTSVTVPERFAALQEKVSLEKYNFEHFQTKHLFKDGQRTMESKGIQPGEEAPDFELPRVDGGSFRLSELRGRPFLLRFGSIS